MNKIITSIVTGESALLELKLQLFTMELWHTDSLPTYYIFTDDETEILIKQIKYGGVIHTNCKLNAYNGLKRSFMENRKGIRFPTLWSDLMAEKINCIRWAFESEGKSCPGVFFMDSDITLLAPMPEIPEGTDVALSPHYIKKADTNRFGYYNGGFGWLSRPELCTVWDDATMTSRFFEQAALEEVAKKAKKLYEFPIQVNFGWWRMYQADDISYGDMQKRFGYHRQSGISGLTFDKLPLYSIHTHFSKVKDPYNNMFNRFILEKLLILKSHPPANELYQYIQKTFK